VFRVVDVLGEGKQQGFDRIAVTVTPRLHNHWDLEAHRHSLLSNSQLIRLAMAPIPRSSVLRNVLRSSVVVGSQRGVATKAYPDHIPLSAFEHAFLTVGTGLAALLDPRRGGEYDEFAN